MQPRPNAAARGGGAKNDPPDKSKPKSRKSQPSPERTNPVRAQWQGDNQTKTTQTGKKSKAAAKRQLQQDNSPSGKSPDHKKGNKNSSPRKAIIDYNEAKNNLRPTTPNQSPNLSPNGSRANIAPVGIQQRPLIEAAASLIEQISPGKKTDNTSFHTSQTPTTSRAQSSPPACNQPLPSDPEDSGEDSDEDSSDNSQNTTSVTLKCENINFNKISSIGITRALRDLSLGDFSAKPMKDGELKVMVLQSKVSLLLSLKSFMNHHVIDVVEDGNGSNHGPRDYVWGKIYSRPLINCSDDEILEELNYDRYNPEILEAKRIYRGREKQRTSLIKIKFKDSIRPKSVHCLGIAYDVTEFFPPVKKCHKCNVYNHHWTRDCEGDWVCHLCDKMDCPSKNAGTPCPNQERCKYCGPGHATSSNQCPKYKKEREIVTISHEKNISFLQARKNVELGAISETTKNKIQQPNIQPNQTGTPRTGISYNQAVKANIICNIVDSGTGDSDGIGSDTMAREIDEKLANPGDLTVIYPRTTPVVNEIIQNHDLQREVEKVNNFLPWVENAPEEIKDKFLELSRKFCECIEMLQTRHSIPNNERLPF